jgi:hypothetical protein
MNPRQDAGSPLPSSRRAEIIGAQDTVANTGTDASSAANAPKNPPAPSNPNSTQNSLQISEIRDGVAIMNDGTFRAVIMCKSINFDLMSPQEREAVEFSYQGFLNSLYFPVQIFVRSEKVDIRPYLEKLDKIRTEEDNMLLALLMDDYISFLADIAQQTNIMSKKFYLAISYPEQDEELRSALNQSRGWPECLVKNLYRM